MCRGHPVNLFCLNSKCNWLNQPIKLSWLRRLKIEILRLSIVIKSFTKKMICSNEMRPAYRCVRPLFFDGISFLLRYLQVQLLVLQCLGERICQSKLCSTSNCEIRKKRLPFRVHLVQLRKSKIAIISRRSVQSNFLGLLLIFKATLFQHHLSNKWTNIDK